MIKRIIAAAVWSAVSTQAYAIGISDPTSGVMDHVVSGSVFAPIVEWVDEPNTTTADGTMQVPLKIGALKITLRGTTTKFRYLLLSNQCGVGGKPTFDFVNTTDLANNVTGNGPAHIIADPVAPAGWADSGFEETWNDDGVTRASYGEAWSKAGVSATENVTVDIKATSVTGAVRPGVYTSTYCVQQMVE